MLTENDVIINCDESGTRTVTVKGKTVFSSSHPTFLVDVDDSRILLQCLEPSTEAFAGTAWKSYRVSLQESPAITVSEVIKDLLADNKWLRKRLNELEVNVQWPNSDKDEDFERILNLFTPDGVTVRSYLCNLLQQVWNKESGFDGKRPFGYSYWKSDLLVPLAKNGFIEASVNEPVSEQEREKGFALINSVIAYVFRDTHEILMSAMLSIKNYGSHPSVEAHQCPMDVPVNNLPATEKTVTSHPCVTIEGDTVVLLDNGRELYRSDRPFQIVSVDEDRVKILEQVVFATHTNYFEGEVEKPYYDWADTVTEILRKPTVSDVELKSVREERDRLVKENQALKEEIESLKKLRNTD